jgi:predicted dehydrogenase
VAILRCSSGALGTIEALTAVPGGSPPATRWINGIDGTEGQIALPTPWGEDGLALFTRASAEWTEIEPERGASARARTFEAFAEAVLDGREPPIPARDGVRASRIVHAVYEAARSGTPVDVTADEAYGESSPARG